MHATETHTKGSTALLGALALICIVVMVSPDGSAAAGPAAASRGPATQLVHVARPAQGQLVRHGRVRLVVAAAHGARPIADVDGVDVTHRLRAGAKGTYTANLSLGHGLHDGINDVFVHANGNGARGTYDHTRFVVAKRNDALLTLSAVVVGTRDAPVRVTIRRAAGARMRAYLNGRRVDAAFAGRGTLLVGRLGGNDGLRRGSNRLLILVDQTHASQRRSTYDIASRTIRIGRGTPLASAGRDRTVIANHLVELDAAATKLPPGSAHRSFAWTLVSAPPGSKAPLLNASARRPRLTPDVPGRYTVRVSVRGTGGGIGARSALSRDTVVLTVEPDVKPTGMPLETMLRDRGIRLNGQRVSTNACCADFTITYVVIDRRTLQPVPQASGWVGAYVEGIKELRRIVTSYTGSQDYFVVLNWLRFDDGNRTEGPGPGIEAVRNEFSGLLEQLGVARLTDDQRGRVSSDVHFPGSAIGVPGAAAGSAFVSFAARQLEYLECGRDFQPCDIWATLANMSGSLRRNGATGKFDFVFTDIIDFDTEANQTAGQISPAQLTIKVGAASHTQANPGEAGAAGFHFLRLDAKSLAPLADFAYRTNDGAGNELPFEVQRLANDLKFSADQASRPLVILQAYGTPHGNDAPWDEAAKQIQRLGGTRQVFDAMNATDPRGENGEDANRKGTYAFVGRVNSNAPRAEASFSNDGLPGRLRGELMRARDGTFEPMMAAPAGRDGQSTVNTELIRIVNQAPQAFPAFKNAAGGDIDPAHAQAVQNFLGGPEVTKLCSAAVTTCDIRSTYYLSYGSAWASVQGDLTDAEQHKCPGVHAGFSAEECEAIRAQLRDEVSKVAKVTTYFGPTGLQQPYGAASVAALADLVQISQEIKDAVNPPPADNTTSNVLTGISYFLKLGGFAPPPAAQIAAGLSGAFAIAGYFTTNGTANLIGPKITTSASKLGVELAQRYARAGDNLDDVGRMIVSDYAKLNVVASKVSAAPGPGETDWRLGTVREDLRRASKQTIYERLVPLAYPVLYDLGESGNARGWYCDGGIAFDKNLFNDQPDSGQFIGRFASGNPGYYAPTMVVAQANARGRGHDARIAGPPASVTDPLFQSAVNGGIGLTKLEFYSPRNGFRLFPADPVRFSGFSGNDWTSLNQFPRGRPDVITCPRVPDPPGNAG
jgi:hypothetical protein